MEQPQTLTGRRVIVTGGGVGIGLGIVRHFAAAGAQVALTTHSRSADEVVQSLSSEGFRVYGARLDATDSTEVDSVIADLAGRLGGLDVLVNNAGGLIGRHTIAETRDEHWARVWNVNVSSTFYLSRAALRHLGDAESSTSLRWQGRTAAATGPRRMRRRRRPWTASPARWRRRSPLPASR